jgi:electron transfer flavoprotein beta subunit
MKIAVLVSVGRHPVSGVARYSRNDAAALTIALSLAKRPDATLDVFHAGDPSNAALKDYLALGARSVEVLDMSSGADSQQADAATLLTARLRDYDLVLSGTRAEGAFDSGMLPYRVAQGLDIPLVGAAVELTLQDGIAQVRQFMPKGLRRRVEVTLPALIAVHPLANAAPTYAYARLRDGTIYPGAATSTLATERSNIADSDAWTIRSAPAKPVRLAAAEKRSGHARMLSATTTESRGGSVVIEGSSVEKAQVILAYLREHQLVDY